MKKISLFSVIIALLCCSCADLAMNNPFEESDLNNAVKSVSYTVVLEANNGSTFSEKIKVEANTFYTIPTCPFQAADSSKMEFDSWNTIKSGLGLKYFPGTKCVLSNTEGSYVSLYAQWKYKTYKIIYTGVENADNSANPTTVSVNDDVFILANPISNDGRSLFCWEDIHHNPVKEIVPSNLTGDLYLTAIWNN